MALGISEAWHSCVKNFIIHEEDMTGSVVAWTMMSVKFICSLRTEHDKLRQKASMSFT